MGDKPRATVLVTGAARRIGASICEALHEAGYDIALHYHQSAAAGEALATELNQRRADSCKTYSADLASEKALEKLCRELLSDNAVLSGLVNNASVFAAAFEAGAFDGIINGNLRAPWYLCHRLHKALQAGGGAIVNIVDAHTRTPAPGFDAYDASKRGLAELTRTLAYEFAPDVRVNAVAPGAILWPEADAGLDKAGFLRQIPLQRLGNPADIAGAVLFLLDQAPYVTGQVLAVDGGRSLES
jgi:pteridine reductase